VVISKGKTVPIQLNQCPYEARVEICFRLVPTHYRSLYENAVLDEEPEQGELPYTFCYRSSGLLLEI